MFERVAPSDEQRDADAREGRSPDQVAALRLAALLVLVDVLLSLAVAIAFGNLAGAPILWMGVRLAMAYYLFKLRPRAEALALGLTILAGAGAVAGVVAGQVTGGFNIFGYLFAIPALGGAAALLLLLLGDPRREKRQAALWLFGILVCLPELLLLVLEVTGSLHRVGAPAGA
ncbi:MAG: hypothetical protein ABI682_00750 [Acidobacteriota bacterium]